MSVGSVKTILPLNPSLGRKGSARAENEFDMRTMSIISNEIRW